MAGSARKMFPARVPVLNGPRDWTYCLRNAIVPEPPDLLERRGRGVIRAAVADDLDRMPGDRPPGETGARNRAGGLGTVVGDEVRLGAPDVGVVEGSEGPRAVGHDPDLDRGPTPG